MAFTSALENRGMYKNSLDVPKAKGNAMQLSEAVKSINLVSEIQIRSFIKGTAMRV